jgi:hypothetical protein
MFLTLDSLAAMVAPGSRIARQRIIDPASPPAASPPLFAAMHQFKV